MNGVLQQLSRSVATKGVSSSNGPPRPSALLLTSEKDQVNCPQSHQKALGQSQKIAYCVPFKPAMLSAESPRPYSWWWDSHLSPKYSKWLQENLTDMDAKIKAMLKLIEEDADSFAKRAEMYYKKRPELVNLVEEFYRAYRALAERYCHISGELRQVHYTIAEAFPNQIQNLFPGDSPQESILAWASDQSFESPQKTKSFISVDEMSNSNSVQKLLFQTPSKAVFSPNATDEGELAKSQGLKQINEIIQQYRTVEKRAVQLQEDLNHVQEEKRKMKEDSLSQVELINSLKEQLFSLKKRNKEHDDEGRILRLKLEAESEKHQNLRTEIQNLKVGLQNSKQGHVDKGIGHEDTRLEHGAKDHILVSLQDDLNELQQENKRLNALVMTGVQRFEKAEEETQNLCHALSKAHAEQETLFLEYQNNLNLFHTSENKSKDMQVRLVLLQEENDRLNDEVSTGVLQLKVMEDKANSLERDNNTVQQDMGHLIQKTNSLIEELASMRTEEQSLRIRLQDEADERRRIDIALRNCQQALSESQEQQEKLTAEIQLGTEKLKDADREINFLQGEVFQLEKQNGNMVEQISSASVSIKNLEEEISKLKQVKSDLSNEVAFRMDQRNALQQELYCLQEERNDLDRQFQAIKKQIEPLGLDTNSLHSSFVNLRNDNQQLMKLFKEKEDENGAMANITKGLEEELVKRSTAFENLVSSHTIEVERLKDDIKKLQLLLQDFQEEKVTLMAERELHGKQRSVVETNLHDLENRFSELEKENLDLNSKLKNALGHVENLSDQLHFVQSEKEKNQYEVSARNAQISQLEKQVSIVEAERNDLRIKMQEETEKQEKTQSKIGRLEKLLEQTQDRNTALSNECQKHSDELVAVEERLKELEMERQTQKMENVSQEKYFSLAMKSKQDMKIQIRKLQNLLALPDMGEVESEGTDTQSLQLLNTIIEKVKIMQADFSTVEDANKKLSNAASAMSTCVEFLKNDTSVWRSEKKTLEQDAAFRSQHLKKLQEEHITLQQAAESLRTRLQASEEREKNLLEEAKNLQHSLASSENAKLILQDEHQRTLQDCNTVKIQITELQGRFCVAEQEVETLLTEILTQISHVTVLESNIAERNMQIQQLLDSVMKLDEEKKGFENEVKTSSGKLQILDVKVQSLQKSLQSFEEHKRQAYVLQNEFNLLNEKCDQVNLQLETDRKLVKEKDTMLDELRRDLQVVQEEKTALVRDMESMKDEDARGQMTLSELRLQVSSMTEEILHLRQAESSLEEEVKNLQHSLLSSHDAHLLLQDEHQRTLLDYNSMRTQIDELKGRFSVTDQENTMLLVEALTQMSLLTVLESNALQRDEQVQQLVGQLNKLQTGNTELENKVQTGSGKLQMLELDVQKLHELMQSFNEEKRTADTLNSETKLLNEKCEQMNLRLQSGVDLLREKDKMLGEFKQQLHAVHDEKKTLFKDLESAKVQHISSEMTASELRLQVSSLMEENICLKQELSATDIDRTKAREELNGLQRERETFNKMLSSFVEQEKEFQNDVKQLQEEGEVLRCQLQKQTEHSTVFEQEVEELHESLQYKEMHNVLLRDENQKIYSACKLLEAQRRELEEELLSMKQMKKKQENEEEGRIAQIREQERNIADLETKKSIAGAVAIKILGLAAPLKNDLCVLRELVLDQMTALKMDTQKLQDYFLNWHQNATSKMPKTNMELSLEEQSRSPKAQKLQTKIKHIIAEQEKKNQKLEDVYHITIEDLENCDVMARGEDIVIGKSHLESENSSLKMELHEHMRKASQLQEERNAIEDELHLQEREVESLKSKLEETKELYMQVLKLLELVIGPDSNHVSLNIENFQFAEDKLKEIYKGMYYLRQEEKKLKDDTMHMSSKIDKLEAAGSSNRKEEVNNRRAQSHNQGRNLQQKSQQIEAENWIRKGAMPRKPNEERNKYVTLEIGCKNGINNATLGKKEKMLFQRHAVEATDSHVCRDEALLQMQGSACSLEDSEVDNNNNIFEETEHFQEKYTRLERQVLELSEKAKKFDAKSQEAQDLAMKLEELQPSIADSQKIKERLKELQAHIKSLQQENIHLKEISHGEEVDFVEVDSLGIQEEKEVVVDESKGPINTTDVIQEIDIFQEENRKNWGRLDFVTKKVQNLQNAIQELQRRSKSLKQKNKKLKDDRWWKGLDYNSLEKQLRELQGQVKQLVEHNSRLRKDVKYVFACMSRMQDDMSGHEHKFDEETLRACQQNAKIAERLESSSEKARILESEVQRIRVTLARFQQQILDDVPKIKVPLRAFLVGSRREHPPKQQAFCICVHPPPTRD